MTEQERLAAALAYQQAQPALMNPNLARQGARGRENMMPPTSVMDERYPAWKRNQEDAEKLMLGLDIVGSAIPLAGPAAKGAVAVGKYAAPQIAQGLENYAFRTGMALPMDVWHGTPHRFPPTAKNPLGEFDPTKIGTGEGMQVYGYGHYLAEAPDTAKEYIRAGRNIGFENRDDAARLGEKAYAQAKGDKEKALQILDDLAASTKSANRQNNVFFAKKMIQEGTQKSSLYKVDLPDEAVARMLDWDKLLNQQPVEVKKFLSNVSFNPPNQEQKIGEWLKPRLAEGMAPNWADDMRKAGIPGIKYLDEASRGAGTGTRNFVVFPGNEGLLNILGRE